MTRAAPARADVLPDACDVDAVSDALIEHALKLLSRTQCGDAAREAEAIAALKHWRSRSAAQEAAAAEAALHWARAGGVARALDAEPSAADPAADTTVQAGTERLLARIDAASRARAGRRRAVRHIAGGGTALVLLLAVGWGGLTAWRAPVHEQSFTAERGQQVHAARLPDGTVLDIDADTRVQLRYTRQGREATLAHGQLHFDVAHEQRQGLVYGSLLPATRPFVVHTRAGRVEVLGTAFTVSDRGGAVSVVVERGHVRVTARGDGTAMRSPPATVDLRPDDAVRIEPDGSLGPVRRADGADAAAWRQGWLAFDSTPLAEAVAQVNAGQREGSAAPAIELSPQAAALRITGRFRANDPRAFVAALPGVLPVRVDATDGDGKRLRIEHRAEK